VVPIPGIDGFRNLHQLAADVGDEFRCTLIRAAFFPWLQDGELDRRVRLRRAGQEVQAADRTDNVDAGRRLQDVARLLRNRVGALQRSAVGQLDDDEEVALVLDRKEGRRQALPHEEGGDETGREQAEHDPSQTDEDAHAMGVGMRHPVESGVEPAEQYELRWLAVPQEGGAQRRAQRE